MISVPFRLGGLRTAAALSAVFLVAATCRAAAEGPVTQTQINELAASLLRAHRALIEEPALRKEGEWLGAYLERIAAPQPGESDARYREREAGYVVAIERAADSHRICKAVPMLRDSSSANVERWTKAVRSSALLPKEAAAVRTAWAADERTGHSHTTEHRLAASLTQFLLEIKTAYEALRDARP